MASFVNAADVVSAAVEIERRGHAFYVSVAEKATKAEDKEFFTFMAKEELRHEEIFAAMLRRIGGLDLPSGSNDEEYLAYMRSLLDFHALFMADAEQRALADPFHQAMQFEKDTMIFFLGLEDLVPESEKHHVRECADEERRHLRMIAKHMAGRV